MFTVSREAEITPQLMCDYIELHNQYAVKLNELYRYYVGKHLILGRAKKRSLANNKIIVNHAKYITLISAGYMCGSPISYQSKSSQDLTELNDWIEAAEVSTQDMDIATDQSAFGLAYELGYIGEDEGGNAMLKLSTIDPRNAFVVYENNVTYKPVAACYYYPVNDIRTQEVAGYECTVITDTTKYEFRINSSFMLDSEIVESVNEFGMINLFEVYNNKDHQGDFEQQISLIDAYNKLMSDRLNDKEQFVEALMVLKGQTLGDTLDERSEMYQAVRDNGVIEIDSEGDISFLTRQLDEAGSEVLRKSIIEDIGRTSCVPQMLDESFSGNSSGVALSYKFFPLDQIIKVKEKYFRECVKNRLRLYNRFRHLTGQAELDISDIRIKFKHILPKNELEEAQKASMLKDIIPDKENLSQLSFIEDPEAVAEEMKKQKEENKEQFMRSPVIPEEDDE
ncbi:MAG: phage portal protein [Oscillospiraceae bacterium]|nr:phage portal protein [Oscillospiraceae bacterium]